MTSSALLQPLSLEVSWFSIKFVPARFSYSLKAASKRDRISEVCVEDVMQADGELLDSASSFMRTMNTNTLAPRLIWGLCRTCTAPANSFASCAAEPCRFELNQAC